MHPKIIRKQSYFPIFSAAITFIFLLFPTISADVQAQVLNIESYRKASDTTKSWAGALTFGFTASKQKTQSLQLNNRTNAAYFGESHLYMLITNLSVLQVDDNLESNGYVHLRNMLFYNNTLSPELFTQLQYSQNWGLKRRFLVGAALRYNFISTDSFTSAVTSGFMYENELWQGEEAPRQLFNQIKSTTSLLMRGNITETTSLVLAGYYQTLPGDILNPRLTGDIELRFRISENIQFGAQFVTTYDYAPPIDVVSWIYSFRNNITISL
ncbi:MAG: DUF481 domain-containing protein [Balneolales bacterium]|nr:DUF481 domain-containing protein [Balneolales bacterium]